MEMLASIPLATFQRLRRLALLIAFMLAAFVLLFCSSTPSFREAHEIIEAVGLGLIAAAIVGRVWCTLYIGGRKASEIVDTGPYSVTRNPLYVFSAIGATGVGAQTGSIVVALLFGVLTVAAFHVVILREEKHLAQHFGAAYAAYCARIPRFVPDLRLFRENQTVIVYPRRLYATFLDGLVFVVAVPTFELIEYAQATGIVPVLVRLP